MPSGNAEAVTIPFLNPNEVDGVLVSLAVKNGQKVVRGDVLATFETTKATADILAEADGYVVGLDDRQGQAVHSGDLLCYLGQTPDVEIYGPDLIVEKKPSLEESGTNPAIPPGLRLTQPAQAFLQQHPLDLSLLPEKTLVTEAMVRELYSRSEVLSVPRSELEIPGLAGLSSDQPALIIYGGGGHGKSVIEMLRLLGKYHLVGVVDDGLAAGTEILGLPVLGGKEILAGLYRKGLCRAVNAVGGIGNLLPRLQVFAALKDVGFICPTVVHPTAFVEASASLADGIQVFPHAYIGSSSRVGFGSIVNTGAIVSHDCMIGETANLSPGAILAGAVQVGDKTLIGMGVTVNLEVKIGSGVRIGNGATIKADVPDGTIVRAGSIWPLSN